MVVRDEFRADIAIAAVHPLGAWIDIRKLGGEIETG